MIQQHLTRILKMLADDQAVSPVDINALSSSLADLDRKLAVLNKWIRPGTDHAKFDYVQIKDFGAPTLQAGAVVHRESSQTLTPPANVQFTSVEHDTHGFADLTANNERLTVPPNMGGLYLCGCNVGSTYSSALDWRLTRGGPSGVAYIALGRSGSSSDNYFSLASLAYMVPGDYIVAKLFAGSTAPQGSATAPLLMWLTRVAAKHAGKTVR